MESDFVSIDVKEERKRVLGDFLVNKLKGKRHNVVSSYLSQSVKLATVDADSNKSEKKMHKIGA